jgi:hypothetical protein
MARPRILDKKIMSKIGQKIGKEDITVINTMVSRKARSLGISSEAALIILAKEYNIGTSTYQRSLDATKQAEVRDALLANFASTSLKASKGKRTAKKTALLPDKPALLKSALEYLIEDDQLRDRCVDILLASSNFDRPINQATQILEERIRNKAKPPVNLVGENLVTFAFNEEISKTVLRVASGDPNDQRGFTQILRGIVPTFRNKTHHHIINTFSRNEAMRVCGFVDVLLRVVDNSEKVR